MEQEGEGIEGNNRQPLQQQRCPRCDSMNTKFCYYNNYSLSQPRYFCKACKRYWTQGGTFRNIPIGGSSHKRKRTKRSSSSSMSQLHQQLLQEVVQNQPNMTTLARPSLPLVVHSTNPSQPLNQSLKVGGDVVTSSNSPRLSGFNAASLLGSQQHHLSQIRTSRFFQIGNRDKLDSLYTVAQGVIPSSVANNGVASHFDQWPQSFISSNANNRASDSSVWSTISTTTSISGNSDQNNIRGGDSSSLNPNHWPHLPGYGPAQ